MIVFAHHKTYVHFKSKIIYSLLFKIINDTFNNDHNYFKRDRKHMPF